METDPQHYCGFVAIVGRPNVGKSTLLNSLLGEKLSITSPKPQTTRHRICGIKTVAPRQLVFLDTPGLHRGATRALNRAMNRTVGDTIADADIVVFVIEALRWRPEDDDVLKQLERARARTILAVNKVDRVQPKSRLLPFLQDTAARYEFAAVVPISARKRANLKSLEDEIGSRLPAGPWLFPADQLTDRSEAFRVAETIREKLTLRLQQELPYGIVVEVERLSKDDACVRIAANIWVERQSQKAIVIGKGGAQLKAVGQAARVDLERLFGRQVFVELWVKEKSNWSDDARALRSLGYDYE